MKQVDFSELAHNEQFVFVEGHSDSGGSHVFRKVVEGGNTYAFTLVDKCKREEVRDIDPQTKVIRVRFFPLG